MASYSRIQSFIESLREGLVHLPGTQQGSNEGGIHRDTDTGEEHYVKHYRNPEQGKAEALAGRIYQQMGIPTTNPEFKDVNGRPAVVSKWNPNLQQMRPEHFESLNPAQAGQIGRMYHAAILTKNWDAVGLAHDNILKHKKTGDLHAVDTGGTFHFRAQGAPKEYGPDIDEHTSLRKHNPQAAHVFNSVFKAHPDAEREGLKAVKNLDDKKIRDEFEKSGLHNWKELHSNFVERKKKLLAKYP